MGVMTDAMGASGFPVLKGGWGNWRRSRRSLSCWGEGPKAHELCGEVEGSSPTQCAAGEAQGSLKAGDPYLERWSSQTLLQCQMLWQRQEAETSSWQLHTGP